VSALGHQPVSGATEGLGAILAALDEGYCLCEIVLDDAGEPVDYRFLEINEHFEAMTGLVAPVGRTAYELVPGLESHWLIRYAEVAFGTESVRFEGQSDAMGRRFEVFAAPVAPRGRFALVFRDVTERRRAELILHASSERDRFRAALTATLRDLTSPLEIQEQAARLLGETLAVSRAFFATVDDEGVVEIQRDFHSPDLPSAAGRYRPEDFGEHVARAFADGSTLAVDDIDHDPTLTDAQRSAFSALDIRSHVTVFVSAGGRPVALVGLRHASPRRWTEDEVALVEETAERVLAAVGRSRADVALRESEERFRRLADIAPAFIWMTDADGRIEYLSQRFLAFTGASFEQVVSGPLHRLFHQEDGEGALAAFQEALADRRELELEYRLRRADDAYRWMHCIAVPRFDDDRFLGYVGSTFDIHDRRRAEEEQRAQRDAEHRIAVHLQRSLLPREVLRDPRIEIAARWEASGPLLQVGGDWYESFALDEHRVVLAVGDVVGHGVEAAAAMGRLRTAMAALAPYADDPGDLLHRLDVFGAEHGGPNFVTLLVTITDLRDGRMRFASAGHPPFLILPAQGPARWQDAGLSPPLLGDRRRPRPVGEVRLSAGDAVVLYSDGLVERRNEAIDHGLDRLRTHAVALADRPADEVCDGLLAAMREDGGWRDDVIVVVARLGRGDAGIAV